MVDILTGGTVTCNYAWPGYPCTNACDDNEATYWDNGVATSPPHWWKYDLGVGVAKVAGIFRIKNYAGFGANAFNVQGSNDDSSWTTLYTGNCANNGDWQEFPLSNIAAYRYYKLTITSVYYANGNTLDIYELELLEKIFQPWAIIL